MAVNNVPTKEQAMADEAIVRLVKVDTIFRRGEQVFNVVLGDQKLGSVTKQVVRQGAKHQPIQRWEGYVGSASTGTAPVGSLGMHHGLSGKGAAIADVLRAAGYLNLAAEQETK